MIQQSENGSEEFFNLSQARDTFLELRKLSENIYTNNYRASDIVTVQPSKFTIRFMFLSKASK
ncbi:hypothetical protein TTHERM_000693198 (macronuclear) [Tetrahymena thermophila SB210]|uniref:Uncharacterized protein n=1 Tax=Tetrahymena thermophila (strain SB210) TaxID=312017 RepID=W7X405_TETTS|nr:hypothetical protein TTHERM_000693198 [Tetrahymena thermophila SB210]EWS72167.1 hypothetical protein TTHERM_000693198 [Tetrahymena thermophila SB210]|eukprot:XP_012655298.1 hypothetical protein TTHERM_000693198 [Tetrahymena thermophila SB210]